MEKNLKGNYANIIVDISHEKVDRPFQYRIPDSFAGQIQPGMKVQIPFGRSNKLIDGYVMELTDKPEYPVEKLKSIQAVAEGGISIEGSQIRLAAWLRRTYGSTMIAAMKTVLPVKQKVKAAEKKSLRLKVEKEEAKELLLEYEQKHQRAKARLMKELLEYEQLPYSLVTSKLGVTGRTISGLVEKQIVEVQVESVWRNPIKLAEGNQKWDKKILTKEQQAVVDAFVKDFNEKKEIRYLIHGITGSGKTEVYMEMIEQVLRDGKEAIVLIPEIALTYQTLSRFYKRFGEQVSVVNSKLSAGEKYDQFLRAKKGEVRIMIGPRTALFTPFQNLGLIVMDEEHEGSYKSDTMPRFHARETAEEIVRNCQGALVLGSATPSLEAYYRAEAGSYRLFTLKNRLEGAYLPTVYTVDLREELKQGNRSIFSNRLKEAIADRLRKKQQVMLFLNRRGYAGFISCRSCGYVVKCPHCDVSLTHHFGNGKGGRLVCHYCGYEREEVTLCPECGSKYISGFKAGTEQIEQKLREEFPTARVLRMDGDTTRKKDDYEKILSAFSNEEADILVGTQMIVKGHDFKKVTLVGILAADLSLSANDYRAAERTFQLLTQAAGRAGRDKLPGEVVIQTYQPEHYSIVHAANQDYEAFYKEEIAFREIAGYPPAAHMLGIFIQSRDEKAAHMLGNLLAGACKEAFKKKKVLIIGPAKATIEKVNDTYRYVIYGKHKEYGRLIEVKDFMEELLESKKEQTKQVSVTFDFDPMNGF
ncbi:MAG: primosomal protein N' [Roseburia sp.]|nr:primosomal protein N' [Roseburia sp.]MCM1278535.1 primosomal protein N' [Robinsoniella sp.]